MKGGYFGKMLRVNLSGKKITDEPIGDDFALKYIGGSGFAAHYVFTEINPDIDPLSKENKLIFAADPFSGTSFPAEMKPKCAAFRLYRDPVALNRCVEAKLLFKPFCSPICIGNHNGDAQDLIYHCLEIPISNIPC